MKAFCISKEHLQPHIWVVPSLFQEVTCSDLVFSRVLCFFEQALAVIPFFKGIELISNSSCSDPFDEWPIFYNKKTIAATHSFKFTVFLQNRNCSKEISQILIMIPLWFQACIYWKKSVLWRHQFQLSIFSMVVPLINRSTWSDPYVKRTVFIS